MKTLKEMTSKTVFKMNIIYLLVSIIFRILYSIAALIMVSFDFLFSRIVEENDHSLDLPLWYCFLCIFTITIFHNVSVESVLSKVLQVISILFISTTLIGSLYLMIAILKNNGSMSALIFLSILFFTSIPLIFFVIKNRKYGYDN